MSTAIAIAAAVQAGQSARIEVDHALERAQRDTTNAVIRIHAERARAAASRVDQRIAAGERLPLAGVPIAVKDNLCVEGLETTACSKILAGFIPPYTATAVARLEQAGAVVVATTNMDEFAFGSSNETSAYGPVRNPRDPTRIPGGSSGGSAAAVAAGIVPLALGSDTGGSIRQPASLCGVVGMKPTYGCVSRYGLIAFGSSLDQIGPLATTVADAGLCLEVMAGHDGFDSTSAQRPTAGLAAAGLNRTIPSGLRVGYVPAHATGLASGVAARLEAAKRQLAQAGATLVPIEMPHETYAVAVYYVIATGEAASNLSRFDGIRYGHRTAQPATLQALYGQSRAEGFGWEAKRRIMLGTYALSAGYYDAYYAQAQRVRTMVVQAFERAYASVDVLLGATAPTTAFALGDKVDDPMAMYMNDVCTIPSNLSGHPAVSVPFGVGADGLPVGVQVLAPALQEALLFRVAQVVEDGAL